MTKEELIAKIIERQSSNPYWEDLTTEDSVSVSVVQDLYNEWVVKYLYPNGAISYSYESEFVLGSDTREWLKQLNKLYP